MKKSARMRIKNIINEFQMRKSIKINHARCKNVEINVHVNNSHFHGIFFLKPILSFSRIHFLDLNFIDGLKMENTVSISILDFFSTSFYQYSFLGENFLDSFFICQLLYLCKPHFYIITYDVFFGPFSTLIPFFNNIFIQNPHFSKLKNIYNQIITISENCST